MNDPRVTAIRNDKLIGSGTCSTVDEAYGDAYLIEELDEEKITTPEAAVKWAIELEDLRIYNALNHRWGEDDDHELKRMEEWEQRKKDFKGAGFKGE
jgi:hypothetical protein